MASVSQYPIQICYFKIWSNDTYVWHCIVIYVHMCVCVSKHTVTNETMLFPALDEIIPIGPIILQQGEVSSNAVGEVVGS